MWVNSSYLIVPFGPILASFSRSSTARKQKEIQGCIGCRSVVLCCLNDKEHGMWVCEVVRLCWRCRPVCGYWTWVCFCEQAEHSAPPLKENVLLV